MAKKTTTKKKTTAKKASPRKRVTLAVPKATRTPVSEDAAQRFETGDDPARQPKPEPPPPPAATPAQSAYGRQVALPSRDLAVTTVRLTRAQHAALRMKALELAGLEGGKPDASALLRVILDQWIVDGSPLPE